jgi:hypothetical protein
MEKDVHLFEILKTIFLFKIFELGKAIFEVAENSNDLNRFDFELNLTRRHCSRGLLIIAQPPLLGAAPRACTLLTCSHQPWVGVCRRLPSQPPLSLPHGRHPRPPPLFFPADRHADKSHRPLPRPLFTLSPIRVLHRAHPSPHPLASCPHWPSSLSPPSRESRPPPPLLPSLSELYHPVLPLLIRPHIGLSSLSQCSRACPW